MKIKYESVTGAVEEIDVSAEYGEFIVASRREESNSDRRHRYHAAFSLDGAQYEGQDFAADETPESEYLTRERNQRLYAAMDRLTSVQRRRLEMYADGMSFREIARLEGVDHKQIKKSVEQARKKIRNIF